MYLLLKLLSFSKSIIISLFTLANSILNIVVELTVLSGFALLVEFLIRVVIGLVILSGSSARGTMSLILLLIFSLNISILLL